MVRDQVPIVILGGSDRKPVELPAEGHGAHPLSGFKAVDVLIEGRPLLTELVERLRGAGRFAPVYVAGPARVYAAAAAGAHLIDTDGTFGQNIRAAIEEVRDRHPGSPIAFITCDVLPDPETLKELVDAYDRVAPCDLWFPLVRAPAERSRLGASGWKPIYRIRPDVSAEPVVVLPGHLIVVDPAALRLKFLYRLFQIGYKTRNRPIGHRRSVMLRNLITELLWQDFLHLLTLRPPRLTYSVLSAALPTAAALRDGTVTRARLEASVRKIFVRSRHRRAQPDRRVVLPIIDALSLALDIDTEEEARAAGGHLAPRDAQGNG